MSILLIEPHPRPGDWNMAVDAWLLEQALTHEQAAARLYEWDAPTVSLGHFQKLDDPLIGERFAGLPQVRRLSGGGAILHDRELTYSLVIPQSHPLAADPTGLYAVVHDRIIAVLAEFGVEARMRGEALAGPEPFLCFGRGDPRDIVLGGYKILGSAQRRRRGAILQHGALLLARSPHADEFPGLDDLTGVECDRSRLRQRLAVAFRELLIEPVRELAGLNDDQVSEVRRMLRESSEPPAISLAEVRSDRVEGEVI